MSIDDLARQQDEHNDAGPPPRGTPDAARWVERRLGWFTLDHVVIDGREPGSSVVMYLNDGRHIAMTVSDMFSRPRFQATLGAALAYGAPALKQDTLTEIAGAILGLATISTIHSSEADAQAWGIAYTSTVERVPYDDRDDADPRGRYETIRALGEEAGIARAQSAPPPNKALVRASDGALLVVRAWFHYAVQHDLGGERGLSAQRIASLMRRVGWHSPTATHSKVAARRPGADRKTASLAVYEVPAEWSEDAVGDQP